MKDILNFELFKDTLPIVGYGLIGIFVVTGVIILAMSLLNRLTKTKQDNE